MVLEALKEAISAGFESVIALDTLPIDGSEDQRGLLMEIDKVLFDLFSGLAPNICFLSFYTIASSTSNYSRPLGLIA